MLDFICVERYLDNNSIDFLMKEKNFQWTSVVYFDQPMGAWAVKSYFLVLSHIFHQK